MAERLAALPTTSVPRVLFDGAPATGVDELADTVAELVRIAGRPPLRVRAEQFWRDASLRLEWGHEDEQSLYEGWLDVDTLRREVLDPLGPEGDGTWLPSLRDPVTNRSTRATRETAPPAAIAVVSGSLLLVHPLPAELVVHVTASAAALRRRTAPEDLWTVPVYERYDREVKPAQGADVVVRVEDPRHPAVRP